MHGILNRGLQCFIRDIYGGQAWNQVRETVGLTFCNFETMLTYEDMITEQMIASICDTTRRNRHEILEDFGTYLVSEHSPPSVLKLLRLGGETFVDFLYSLEDVNDRVHIAIPELDLPRFTLFEFNTKRFQLKSEFHHTGYGAIFLGLLCAMADHYQTLVSISRRNEFIAGQTCDLFDIEIHQQDWAAEKSPRNAMVTYDA
ncbi:heme NO-binding domain-containing protein [Paramylibacter kogurei]|uniref:heme NO-binding domain-containing protein n=1 Tax=Paramylibacter kogurei TaxID=1889778 RepID=UPI0013FD6BC8|nr:heme NO-binding domain-containing protein [Amylibacter kogurei]